MSGEKSNHSAGGAKAPSAKVRSKAGKRKSIDQPNAARGIDDPNPWRVDAFNGLISNLVQAMPKRSKDAFLARMVFQETGSYRRMLRVAAYTLYNEYKYVYDDDNFNKYNLISNNEFKKRVSRVVNSLDLLIQCGRCFYTIDRNDNDSYEEFAENYGNEQDAILGEVTEARDYFYKMSEKHRDANRKPGPKENIAIRHAIYSLKGNMVTFSLLQIDRKHYYQIAAAAWMDAGLPDIPEKSKKSGETLERWLAKYLIFNDLRVKKYPKK